ncbi:Kin [Symbiodinium sp. KB8]|nr:Kin [Symbiodinium sp. KB8]
MLDGYNHELCAVLRIETVKHVTVRAETCDFISNRHHTHMNSTIWVTLSNFVQYLGRTNQCTIDKTPKGWYLQFVDNSPEARLRAAAAKAKEEGEVSSEQRHDIALKKAIAECKKDGGFQESEFTELQRKEGDAPISFNMAAGSASSAPAKPPPVKEVSEAAVKKNALAQAFETHETTKEAQDTKKHKLSAVERIRLEHEESKRQKLQPAPASPSESSSSGSEPWLTEGIIVKVMHQDLAGGKYYRKKGKVEKVRKQFTADIRMVESRDLIRLDQEMLETVIPNLGKPVMVVKGQYKGKKGHMRTVDLEAFCVTVQLEDGRLRTWSPSSSRQFCRSESIATCRLDVSANLGGHPPSPQTMDQRRGGVPPPACLNRVYLAAGTVCLHMPGFYEY